VGMERGYVTPVSRVSQRGQQMPCVKRRICVRSASAAAQYKALSNPHNAQAGYFTRPCNGMGNRRSRPETRPNSLLWPDASLGSRSSTQQAK
jgi:hypothetical protein